MITSYVKKVAPFHTDERGTLAYLSDPAIKFSIADVLFMISAKGSIRANHYHKTDTHTQYMVSGSCEYITRDMRDPQAPVERIVVRAGEIFTSPPMVAHKVVFLEDSVTIVLTTEPRDRAHYESDTVRLEVER